MGEYGDRGSWLHRGVVEDPVALDVSSRVDFLVACELMGDCI